jgi:hypothetical protein
MSVMSRHLSVAAQLHVPGSLFRRQDPRLLQMRCEMRHPHLRLQGYRLLAPRAFLK